MAWCMGSAEQLDAAWVLREGATAEASSRRVDSAEAEHPWGAGAWSGLAERVEHCYVTR